MDNYQLGNVIITTKGIDKRVDNFYLRFEACKKLVGYSNYDNNVFTLVFPVFIITFTNTQGGLALANRLGIIH